MTGYTGNLNLELPDFNISPWHDAVNNNFRTLDAVLFNSFGFTNIKGPFVNSTMVVAGDKYYDDVSSILYQVVTSYVTSAETTFLEERIAFPANWTPLAVASADAAIAISLATRDEVLTLATGIDTDVATVAADKAIVAADKAIVIADKAVVLGYKNDAAASAASAAAAANSLLEWKGPWVTATSYSPSDIVFFSGSAYICVITHTSGTFATDLSASRWQLFAQQPSAGAGTGDMLNSDNLSGLTNKPLAYTTIGGRAVGLVDLLTYSLIDPTAIITDVETLLANKAVASALPNAKAVADYADALINNGTGYPVDKSKWHPYDQVTNGDAATGVIYSSSVHGTVASVETPNFVDGYEYALEFLGLATSVSSQPLTVSFFRETDGSYGAAMTVIATSTNVDGFVELPFVRKSRRDQPLYGWTNVNQTVGARAATRVEQIDVNNPQKVTKALIRTPAAVGAANIIAGTIIMYKRLRG